jgi:hypothetical protein
VGPVSGELMAELLDQDRLRLQLGQEARREGPQFIWVFGQQSGLVQHGGSLSDWIPSGNPLTLIPANYPAVSGRQVRCGVRQSMPSSNIANCAGVTETLPSAGDGQTKRPRSSRFENRHAPWPSHQITLIRSPRRPRKTNR